MMAAGLVQRCTGASLSTHDADGRVLAQTAFPSLHMRAMLPLSAWERGSDDAEEILSGMPWCGIALATDSAAADCHIGTGASRSTHDTDGQASAGRSDHVTRARDRRSEATQARRDAWRACDESDSARCSRARDELSRFKALEVVEPSHNTDGSGLTSYSTDDQS